MKKLKHIQNKSKSSLTFMILPNSSDKVIQFTLSKWSINIITLFSMLLLLSSIVFSNGYFSARQELVSTKSQINELQLENEAQKLEISDLKSYSIKVEEKLADLNHVQNQVLSMVGLDLKNNRDSIRETEDILQSYTHQSFTISRGGHSNLFISQGYEEEINFLTELIDKEKENMEKFISDIEKQLEYIDALPNLIPNTGNISSPFGYRTSPTGRRREFHNGVDIANKSGTDIVAAGSGVVTYSGYNGGYGRVVIISHGHGYTSIYAHNQKNLVSVGDKVKKGQLIAKVGSTGRSTGAHVHFEVRLNNIPIDPLSLLEN